MGSVNPPVPLPKHAYWGGSDWSGPCTVTWYGTRCGSEMADTIHWIICDLCGREIHPRRLNTLNSKPGFYHPGCAGKVAAFEQERAAIDVGTNWIGRLADAKNGEALLRDLEHRPSRVSGEVDY